MPPCTGWSSPAVTRAVDVYWKITIAIIKALIMRVATVRRVVVALDFAQGHVAASWSATSCSKSTAHGNRSNTRSDSRFVRLVPLARRGKPRPDNPLRAVIQMTAAQGQAVPTGY